MLLGAGFVNESCDERCDFGGANLLRVGDAGMFLGDAFLDDTFLGDAFLDDTFLGDAFLDDTFFGDAFLGECLAETPAPGAAGTELGILLGVLL